MRLNLILDGNFILNKNVFTLHKNNLLFGALQRSLENTISNYKKLYPFQNIYLVSDSKGKSWRKEIDSNYKAQRKKDSDIDWEFVYSTYSDFKKSVKGVKVLECHSVEGDDIISYLIHKSNERNESNYVISNDYDIKQLLSFNLNNLWMNFMGNDLFNKEKLFLPTNYQLFINSVSKLPNDDIFNLNDNAEFLSIFDRLSNKSQIVEVNGVESLVVKLVSGDISDNIKSVYEVSKNGKKRGIGQKGAQSIYETYISEFGEVSINDPDLFDNIADIICEKKKISKSNMDTIVKSIKMNMRLIDLRIDNIPIEIVDKIKNVYEKL